MWENPKNVERAIRRLTREIEEIDEFFYRASENKDSLLYASMLERKRDDMVRSAVLRMHTGIESLLDSLIRFAITGNPSRWSSRSERALALRRTLSGSGSLGFDMKLNLALTLRLVTRKTRDRLAVINSLRNKCSHNWVLKVAVRRGKRPAQKKPPLLLYEGRDLHSVAALKDFVNEYGNLPHAVPKVPVTLGFRGHSLTSAISSAASTPGPSLESCAWATTGGFHRA